MLLVYARAMHVWASPRDACITHKFTTCVDVRCVGTYIDHDVP
jgi:hypothetical protein